MRNKIVLFITGAITLLLSSCLGTTDYDYEVPKNCQITGFKLASDSVPGLDKVKFTIDQLDGRIFNLDSLPYGTKIEKVICTLNLAVGGTPVQVLQETVGDTIWWNGTDSLDFSKPVKFITHSFDGLNTKTYVAKVNIHTLVPDSMVWSLYSDKLIGESIKEQKVIAYESANATSYYMYVKPLSAAGYQLFRASSANLGSWAATPLTGLPADGLKLAQITECNKTLFVPTDKGAVYQSANGQDWTLMGNTPVVNTLLGMIKAGASSSQPEAVLSAIVENNGVLSYAAMDLGGNWKTGDAVAATFPIKGFANLNYTSMYREYLTVLGGRDKSNQLQNTTWATSNGLSWVLLTDMESPYYKAFEKREGAMLAKYDDKFFMTGGLNASGKGLKDIYLSKDNGVNWTLSDTLVVMPKVYPGRGFSSMIVDKDNFMLIFGGKTSSSTNVQDVLWRGRINRLGFKDK